MQILFKDFSSMSQLSPNPIPIVLLDTFCSSLLFIFLALHSTHSQLFAKTILSLWEWTRHSQQCFSPLGVNKRYVRFLSQHLLPIWPPSSALSSALSPIPSEGGEMLSHSISPPQVPLSLFFPYHQVCPTQEAWFLSHGCREAYKLNN